MKTNSYCSNNIWLIH